MKNTMIINNIEINTRTFEDLLGSLRKAKEFNENGKTAYVDYVLESLIENLDKNLKRDKLKAGDFVEITDKDIEDGLFYRETAVIKSINLEKEYPYNLKFCNKSIEVSNQWLWHEGEFKLI